MKKSKIIVPALGLIALSTAASITGTVAWFTANNSVTITGMTFKTQVGNNLLVADKQTGATFTDTVFASELTQNRAAKLEPVSSVDGATFFYTTIANGDGSSKAGSVFYQYSEAAALSDTAADKTAYDSAFFNKYTGSSATATAGLDGTVVYGYVDYEFYLKASISNGDRIIMNKCNMLYGGAALGATDLAWRVGVFAHESSATTSAGTTTVTRDDTVMAAEQNISVLGLTGSTYFTTGKAVSNVTWADAEHHEKGGAKVLDSVTNLSSKAIIHTANADESNKVFKVVVRLWLEGEDTKCYVDNYKALTSAYTLDIAFKIESSTVAVGSTEAVGAITSTAA